MMSATSRPPLWFRKAKRELGKLRPRNRTFYSLFPLSRRLEREILRIDDEDPRDPGGYCPLHKKQALASLIVENDLKRAVEIGVFRGSSIFAQAAAMRVTGGVVVGIDPYSMDDWKQEQGIDKMKNAYGDNYEVDSGETDWNQLYQQVSDNIVRYGLEENCKILRGLSYNVHAEIEDGIDLLHIDGNHDYDAVAQDMEHYMPKIRAGGFVVLDDVDWEGVVPHYDALKQRFPVVYESYNWGILRNTHSGVS